MASVCTQGSDIQTSPVEQMVIVQLNSMTIKLTFKKWGVRTPDNEMKNGRVMDRVGLYILSELIRSSHAS